MFNPPMPQTLDQAHAEILRLHAQIEAQARTIRADTRIIASLRRLRDAAQEREAAE